LSKSWLTPDGKSKEKGTKFNANIEFFLQMYLKTAKEPFNIIEDYIDNGLLKLVKQKDCNSETYQTLNKNTLALHYR
jgi:hypothetical protein